MKTNEIKVNIDIPVEAVFEFTLEPANTSRWIDAIEEETVNTKQIGLGTIYSNSYGNLEVTDYELNRFLELTNQKTGYQCSYSYKKISDDATQITYFECMQDGSELIEPMEQKSFQKLKELLEENN